MKIRLTAEGELATELMRYNMTNDEAHTDIDGDDEALDNVDESTHPNGAQRVTENAFMTSAGNSEQPGKYIGGSPVSETEHIGDFQSDLQKVLQEVRSVIGNTQVTIR